jgi:hypothetical protein
MGEFFVTHCLSNENNDFTFTFRHPHCTGQSPFPLPKGLVNHMSEQRFSQQGGKDSYPSRDRPDGSETYLCRI